MVAPVYYSVGEAARRIGVTPRIISDLLYARKIGVDCCPVVAGRRLISAHYLAEIERALSSPKDYAAAQTAAVAG